MQRLLKQLDDIESEMRAIGYWSLVELPEPEQVTFEHWLQYRFLPTARRRIEQSDIPDDSYVGVMAMRHYDYHTYVPEAQRLFLLLSELDRLVREHAQ